MLIFKDAFQESWQSTLFTTFYRHLLIQDSNNPKIQINRDYFYSILKYTLVFTVYSKLIVIIIKINIRHSKVLKFSSSIKCGYCYHNFILQYLFPRVLPVNVLYIVTHTESVFTVSKSILLSNFLITSYLPNQHSLEFQQSVIAKFHNLLLNYKYIIFEE